MPVVRRSQMHVCDVRVDLCGGDVAVSEQRLHGTRVCAMLQKMGREAVSQRVWRNVFDAHLLGVVLDHGPRKLSRKRPPAIQKHVR